MKLYRPFPIDKEMKIDMDSLMVTKTNIRGDIIYIDDNFESVVGYSKNEIIGTPHDALRHPDMPEVIFFLIIEAIRRGENIQAIVKNLAKSGEYYWATTDFEPEEDEQNRIYSFFSFRTVIPESNITELIELYDRLFNIEKKGGVQASLRYLNSYLHEKGLNYNEFIELITKPKTLMQRLLTKSFTPKEEDKVKYRRKNYKMVA